MEFCFMPSPARVLPDNKIEAEMTDSHQQGGRLAD
jgi:hypothetical protein